jgi:hypothetical protein
LPIVFGPEVLDLALVTRLHPDHYDPDALRRKLRPDAKVLCDAANAPKIARDGLASIRATQSPTEMKRWDRRGFYYSGWVEEIVSDMADGKRVGACLGVSRDFTAGDSGNAVDCE